MKGAVTAGGKRAVDAGLEILQHRGNAADAAAATILALTVTDSRLFCFGGEVPILVYNAQSGEVEVICGQGVAPELATCEHFLKRWGIPGKGVEAAAVPGALGAVLTLLERHGTISFAQAVAPTLVLLSEHRQPWHVDLEATLRRLVAAEANAKSREQGLESVSDCFYRGSIAREIDAWSRSNGGLIRYSDLATHVTRIEKPVSIRYRGHQVFKCGPWTQGPALLEALQILECFDLSKYEPKQIGAQDAKQGGGGELDPSALFHLGAEALELALADRDAYYGDPLYTHVPISALLDPGYAKQRSKLIDLDRASLEIRPGDPFRGKGLAAATDLRSEYGPGGLTVAHDTTTCLTADSKGNVVAATPSGWSGVLAGKTGVWLGSRLQSFNLWEGHPNCIEPGKRPRITLSPTIVREPDGSIFAVSVAGGDNQDQVTLQILLSELDYPNSGWDPIEGSRYLTDHLIGSFLQTKPVLGSLKLMQGTSPRVIEALKSKGHVVTLHRPPMAAAPSALKVAPASDQGSKARFKAWGDSRAGRHSAAF